PLGALLRGRPRRPAAPPPRARPGRVSAPPARRRGPTVPAGRRATRRAAVVAAGEVRAAGPGRPAAPGRTVPARRPGPERRARDVRNPYRGSSCRGERAERVVLHHRPAGGAG